MSWRAVLNRSRSAAFTFFIGPVDLSTTDKTACSVNDAMGYSQMPPIQPARCFGFTGAATTGCGPGRCKGRSVYLGSAMFNVGGVPSERGSGFSVGWSASASELYSILSFQTHFTIQSRFSTGIGAAVCERVEQINRHGAITRHNGVDGGSRRDSFADDLEAACGFGHNFTPR